MMISLQDFLWEGVELFAFTGFRENGGKPKQKN
jgi:hypothetical protein